MEGKVIATNLNGEVMVFDSKEEYEAYNYKLMLKIFDNAFTTTKYDKEAPSE